jgi:hypothetical protein
MVRQNTLILILFAVLLGFCTWAQAPPPPPPEGAPLPPQPGDTRRDVMRLYVVQRMREALAMSDAQTLKAMDVLAAIDKQRANNQSELRLFLEDLRRQLDDPATSDERCKELVAEFQKKQARNETALRELEGRLLAILAPRQQAQYILLRRQLMEEMREGGLRPSADHPEKRRARQGPSTLP